MEVTPGYKQTELGAIPENWELTPFVSLGSVIDGDRGTNYPSTRDFGNDGHCLFLNAGNVTKAGFRFNECAFISREKDERLSKGKLKRDDIVLTTRGTVGNFAYFDSAVPFEHIRINSGMVILRKDSAALDTKFLYSLLQSHFVEKQIKRLTFGSAQPQLTVKGISKFAIVIPPLPEQRAIAGVLRDADALIDSLEQLLAKKRHLKQGAMQELLTGNKRLPGFIGDWEMCSLGSIADPSQRWSFTGGPFGSNLKSSDYTDVGVRIIQLQNIGDGQFKDDYEIYTSRQKADELLSCNIYPGEIILSKMGDPVARACIIPPFQERYVMCSDGIRLAVDKKRFNAYFVYTQINAPAFRGKAVNAGTGSTRKRIGLTELKDLELRCPTLPDQTAIATILSDMDAEIATLEGKLAKARQLKQGMMQELLTGRIRLV